MGPQLNLNDTGRNCLLGNRKKIAKFLMRTFTCRSTFIYDSKPHNKIEDLIQKMKEVMGSLDRDTKAKTC
jgi:hypothetical protein